jgi:hypothetical protein
MNRCAYCNTLILFGGVRDKGMQFCNAACHASGQTLIVARSIPEEVLSKYAGEIHQGVCPVCRGKGPVDVHTSYFVWSALVLTSWSSKPRICCRACGIKNQLGSTLGSALVGWWGFPWGILVTPIQIVRNLVALCSPPAPSKPSDSLRKLAAINLAARFTAEQKANPAARQS